MTDSPQSNSLVQPIADAIQQLEDEACDLAVDGDLDGSEKLMEKVDDLRERQQIGELFHVNI